MSWLLFAAEIAELVPDETNCYTVKSPNETKSTRENHETSTCMRYFERLNA